jgi:hypothetical protein
MLKRALFALVALALLAAPALVAAQQAAPATPVTLTGSRGDAASRCDSATSGTQATLTFQNPGPGLSNYIVSIAVWGLASGVPTAATPTQATMTGVSGTTPKLLPLASVYPAAGAQGSVSGGFVPLATPIKALAGTANAIVGPTAITNMTQEVNACYYAAP